MLTNQTRWSLGRGKPLVPSRWQATPERGPRRKLGCYPWSAVRERQLHGLVVA